jgi:hypothetical protein
MDLLLSINTKRLPTPETLIFLFEFLLVIFKAFYYILFFISIRRTIIILFTFKDNSSGLQKDFKINATLYDSIENIYKKLYKTVYEYILNLILQNPPCTREAIKYYNKVFNNLLVDFRM